MPSFYKHLRHEFSCLTTIRRNRQYTKQYGPPPVPSEGDLTSSTVAVEQRLDDTPSTFAAVVTDSDSNSSNDLSTCVVELVSFQTELYPIVYPVLQEKLLDGGRGQANGAGLMDVKYKSRLNGSESCIEWLPVYLKHVNANIVNKSKASSAVDVDQSMSHVADPYCKVYIVSVDDLEEYRGIIRPLLKKWVTEREKLKEQYIILFIDHVKEGNNENTERKVTSMDASAINDGANSVASSSPSISSSVNDIRKGLQSKVPASALGLTAALRAKISGGDGSYVNGQASHDQLVKELFRKMSYDFGSGKTAFLSIPEKNKSALVKFFTQLGQAIIATFEAKTQSLDEELRSMLDQRVKSKGTQWNFAQFFLAKERLAYTFEHMQLEKEALLQYEELGAFVFAEANLPSAKSSLPTSQSDNSISKFLTRLEANEVTDQELYERLFQRESHFHFLLSRPLEALLLARRFIVSSYKRFLENENIPRTDAEMFAFQACWELYDSSKDFFNFHNAKDQTNNESILYSDKEQTQACKFISSILEFGRRRLLKCAEVKGMSSDSILRSTGKLSHKTLGNWERWDNLNKSDKNSRVSTSEQLILNNIVIKDEPWWILESLVSTNSFEGAYLEMSRHMIYLSERNCFLRSTMRLQHELAEFYILKEDYFEAAQLFQNMIQNKILDTSWDRVYSWLLFRFACCQRHLKSPKEYLPTLIHSFNPRLASVAPTIALDHLLSDLEAIVIDEGVVSGEKFDLFPFLETEITVTPTSEGRVTILSDQIRKRLTLHRAEVGESIEISCKFLSYFPRKIQVNNLELAIMKRTEFEEIDQDKRSNYRLLATDDSITIQPGKNLLSFRWIPMNTGSFVLSSLSLFWGKATFVIGQDLFARKPIQGFDIIQSTPTQKIELGQLPFLLPEDRQEISSTYRSGLDYVEDGVIKFTSSEGLEIMSPLQTSGGQWCRSVSLPIGTCDPDTILSHSIPVRALSSINSMDEVKVTITSNFRHNRYLEEECKNEPPSNAMKCHLEGFMSIQTCLALEVSSFNSYNFGEINILRVNLLSGAPVPFRIKGWKLDLKPPFQLESDGDANVDLFRRIISPREEVLFGFRYRKISKTITNNPSDYVADLVIELLDEFGQMHSQSIPLNIGSKVESDSSDETRSFSSEIEATLECDFSSGNIGAPVPFRYRVDSTNATGSKYEYSIASNESGWILSGKTSGTISAGGVTDLPFIAIPTKSGSLRTFPVIKVHGSRVIVTKVPDFFHSIPHSKNIALAFSLDDLNT